MATEGKMVTDRRTLNFGHIRVRSVHFIYDQKGTRQRRAPQMCKLDLQATKRDLIYRAHGNARSQIAG